MDIYEFIEAKNIPFERYDHAPVYTCEEAAQLTSHIPGAKTKNLFLRDRKGKRHFLVVVDSEALVDLKSLAAVLSSDRLSMGSPERLMKHLSIEPGAVSLLALLNDREHRVEIYIDERIAHADYMQCHPLVNTSTLVLSRESVQTFLDATGHTSHVIAIPERGSS